MKRLIPCLLLVPFLAACEMTEPEYYEAGYYHSLPPRSEIYGFDERPHDYRHPVPHYREHKKQKGLLSKLRHMAMVIMQMIRSKLA